MSLLPLWTGWLGSAVEVLFMGLSTSCLNLSSNHGFIVGFLLFLLLSLWSCSCSLLWAFERFLWVMLVFVQMLYPDVLLSIHRLRLPFWFFCWPGWCHSGSDPPSSQVFLETCLIELSQFLVCSSCCSGLFSSLSSWSLFAMLHMLCFLELKSGGSLYCHKRGLITSLCVLQTWV